MARKKGKSAIQLAKQLAKKDKSIRFCRRCNKLLPIDQFSPSETRLLCREHLRESVRLYRRVNKAKRAIDNIRIRCWVDKKIFGQTASALSCQDIRDMMTADQLNEFSKYSIVPKDPTQQISRSNAQLIMAKCRQYLISCWKVTRDLAQYQHILQLPQFQF